MTVRKKNGGREVGTPNKLTKVQREFVQSLLDSQTAKIKNELNNLSGKEYLSVILSLMDFTMPKLSRVIYQDENRLPQLDNIIIKGINYAKPEINTITIEGAKDYLRELEENV